MADFLIDSDCFLQAYKLHYPLDVATTFWERLAEAANAGTIRSIDRVKAELYTNPDALTAWCDANLPDDFWLDSGVSIAEYTVLIQWANGLGHFNNNALAEFSRAANADPWLASMGMNLGSCVVTQELSNPQAKKRVLLPDACLSQGVDSCGTMEMFRRLELTF